ncbi:SLAM family member 5-like isoform X6 [Hemicordylus capensis]|uniref:SLAM family member 5-like isoform X6 n=1 Tax=Hemicordylus capensis TaxID=884348 RepID=UPI002302CA22|nr:SLAM family member 5-like isoform X6 [Hemicordylus capensis]
MAVMNSARSRHLLIPLVFGAFAASVFGTGGSSAEKLAHQEVAGILGGSVLLHVGISSAKTVAEIEWAFETKKNRTFRIAMFRDGNLKQTKLSDQFGKRLEMANETTLRILDLAMEDHGVYTARVRLDTAEVEDHTFSLEIYELVQDVRISHHLISRDADRCNVTLQCQAFGKGRFNVSWRRGNPLRGLEDVSDRSQLSENGSNLYLFWHPSPSDSNFTCLVSNPVDQKKVSFNLLSICPNGGERHSSSQCLIAGSIVLLLTSRG